MSYQQYPVPSIPHRYPLGMTFGEYHRLLFALMERDQATMTKIERATITRSLCIPGRLFGEASYSSMRADVRQSS